MLLYAPLDGGGNLFFPFCILDGCRYTLDVHVSRFPFWIYLSDLLGERKVFDEVLADLTEMLEHRVAGVYRSTWRQKVRRRGCLLGSRNYVGPAALASQGKVLDVLSFHNNWVFRRRNALQAHRPCIFVHPLLPLLVPILTQAAGSRVVRESHHRWLLRTIELPRPETCA
jgi:hypothetical protein